MITQMVRRLWNFASAADTVPSTYLTIFLKQYLRSHLHEGRIDYTRRVAAALIFQQQSSRACTAMNLLIM
jgi:hypothetical protein